MLDYFKKLKEQKRSEEKAIAEHNKKKILEKMEDYYLSIKYGAVNIRPRYLAIQDYWNARMSGKLDNLNRVKKNRKND